MRFYVGLFVAAFLIIVVTFFAFGAAAVAWVVAVLGNVVWMVIVVNIYVLRPRRARR